MILVTVEILPHGEQEGRRVLGRGTITNVGGDADKGEYLSTFHVCDEQGRSLPTKLDSRVTHMRADGFWPLVSKALQDAK